MNAPQSINSPERFVIRALLLWSLALIATGTVYAFLGDTWAFVVIVVGVLTSLAAWRGHKKGNWCQALYSVLFLVGLALVTHNIIGKLVQIASISKKPLSKINPSEVKTANVVGIWSIIHNAVCDV